MYTCTYAHVHAHYPPPASHFICCLRYRYVFISNVDNLGATVDLKILYHLIDCDIGAFLSHTTDARLPFLCPDGQVSPPKWCAKRAQT